MYGLLFLHHAPASDESVEDAEELPVTIIVAAPEWHDGDTKTPADLRSLQLCGVPICVFLPKCSLAFIVRPTGSEGTSAESS